MKISRIVSGGQTGADQGGLESAIYCSIPYGGWIPKGRKSEGGRIPEKYKGLKETTSSDYRVRTEANVCDSDCTVVFTYGDAEGGSKLTIELAKKHKKPCLHVDLNKPREAVVKEVVQWLRDDCPDNCILNVAGSRESKSPGIEQAVMVRMVDVISQANGKLFYPLSDDYNPNDDTPVKGIDDMDTTRLQEALKAQEKKTKLYHPRTIDEAVDIVLKTLSSESKESIQKMSVDEFAVNSHFGLGMGIRNTMIYQNENIIDLMADFQMGEKQGKWQGMADADTVSGVVARQVWEGLQGK